MVPAYISLRYLDSAVHLSYVLLRMLERWGKQNGQMYIRRASKKKKMTAHSSVPDEEGIPDDDSNDEQIEKMQEMLQEMTLEKFESVSRLCSLGWFDQNYVCRQSVEIRERGYHSNPVSVPFEISGVRWDRADEAGRQLDAPASSQSQG